MKETRRERTTGDLGDDEGEREGVFFFSFFKNDAAFPLGFFRFCLFFFALSGVFPPPAHSYFFIPPPHYAQTLIID